MSPVQISFMYHTQQMLLNLGYLKHLPQYGTLALSDVSQPPARLLAELGSRFASVCFLRVLSFGGVPK
jgi:hypothetical protein